MTASSLHSGSKRSAGKGLALSGALLLALVAAGAGCSSGKREAMALSNVVRRFHEAENVGKPAAADVVAKVACTDKKVCAAKDACVKATGDWGEALRVVAEAQAGIVDLKSGKLTPDDPIAKGLATKVVDAKTKLAAGYDAMPACDALLLALKTEYDY